MASNSNNRGNGTTVAMYGSGEQQPQQRTNMCHLPSEVWFDVLGWVSRLQRAKGANMACRKFHELCQAQEAQVKATLAPLEFRKYRRRLKRRFGTRDIFSVQAQLRKAVCPDEKDKIVVPIAEVVPPKNIVNFEQIKIYHFDYQVFNFLQLIKHLLADLKLHIILNTEPNLPALDFVMPMLLNNSAQLDATFSLVITCVYDLIYKDSKIVRLFERFPEEFERKIHLLAFMNSAMDKNNPGEEADAELEFLVQWLCTSKPLKNGKPRALGLLCAMAPSRDRLIDRIREMFLNASRPVNFLVRFEHLNAHHLANMRDNEFTLENTRTSERLMLRQWNENNWIMRRCPIGCNDQGDTSAERELLEIDGRTKTTQLGHKLHLFPTYNQSIYFCLAHQKILGYGEENTDYQQTVEAESDYAIDDDDQQQQKEKDDDHDDEEKDEPGPSKPRKRARICQS